MKMRILGWDVRISREVLYYEVREVQWTDASTLTCKLTRSLNDGERHMLTGRLLAGRYKKT